MTTQSKIDYAVLALLDVGGYTPEERLRKEPELRGFVVGLSRWRELNPQAVKSFAAEMNELAARYPDLQGDGSK